MMAEDACPSKKEVSETLKQLASHFNQAVHKVEEQPPYFDSVLGKSPADDDSSAVIRFYIDRLTSLPGNTVFDWIVGYTTTVHELLRTPGSNSLPVLQNYELVLSKWLDQVQSLQPDDHSTTKENRERMLKTAVLVSNDLLFVSKNSLELSDYMLGSVMIPTLLRIQYHINKALLLSGDNLEGKNLSDVMTYYVSLLPFLEARLDPPTVDPDLVDTKGGYSFNALCVVPPKVSDHGLEYDDFFSLKAVSWTDVTLDDSTRLCSDIAQRAAKQLCKSLRALLRPPDAVYEILSEADDINDTMHHDEMIADSRVVLRSLGIVQVAQVVRSHFFHREHGHSPQTQTETMVFLGRRTAKKSKPLEDIAYKTDSSVMQVLLNFVRLLEHQDGEHTSGLVPQIVPCCLELIDSTNVAHAALGASALTRLLSVTDHEDTAWRNVKDETLSKLKDASKIHKEGPAVLAIGRAQHMLLGQSRASGRLQASFCQEWFITLHQASVRSTGDSSWEILVGAIVPLLHGMTKHSDAPGIEIGRLGLSALLPLVSGEFVDIRTQIVGTVALINLMVAAHPIMPHHGGKILCHILASFSRRLFDEKKENKEVQCLHELMRHAAALCLDICGPTAHTVIDAIEAENNNYQTSFLEVVTQVRNLAVTLAGHDTEEA
jgi:hypothetical protein